MTIRYITTDSERWGTGLGRPLQKAELDENFYTLKVAIDAAAATGPVSIETIRVVANSNMWVDLTDGSSLGPFELPMAVYNGRSTWQADTLYAPNDIVSFGNSAYSVNIAHTSGAVFSETATDGLGNFLYSKIIEITNSVPLGGDQGMVLVKQSGADLDMVWAYQIGVLPAGGVAGQIPVKNSSTYGDASWSSSITLPAYGQVDVSGAVALDFANGECQRINLIDDVTSLTVSNFNAAGRMSKLALEIWGGDAYAMAWPAGTLWDGGVAPTLGAKAIVVFLTMDGGTTIYGNVIGTSYS